MNLRIDDLSYFTINSFLDYMEDYILLKKSSTKGGGLVDKKQEVYEGADGLDKFLGG